jgi:hypothetical protein
MWLRDRRTHTAWAQIWNHNKVSTSDAQYWPSKIVHNESVVLQWLNLVSEFAIDI